MIKFRIIELKEDKSIKKIWFESHSIATKKSDIIVEIERHYMEVLRRLNDQYNLFGKILKTETSEDDGKTWSFYRDTTIDYWNL